MVHQGQGKILVSENETILSETTDILQVLYNEYWEKLHYPLSTSVQRKYSRSSTIAKTNILKAYILQLDSSMMLHRLMQFQIQPAINQIKPSKFKK